MNPETTTHWVKTFGLDAVTIYKGKPYFFLFADIDTKDKEEFQMKKYKEHIATVLIENAYKNAYRNTVKHL